MCSTTSTTVPAYHNLTMLVSWYIGGQYIATTGRYRVDNNILSIYSMTRVDDGLVVECQAREDKGLTTWANMSISMNCKAIFLCQFYLLYIRQTLVSKYFCNLNSFTIQDIRGWWK